LHACSFLPSANKVRRRYCNHFWKWCPCGRADRGFPACCSASIACTFMKFGMHITYIVRLCLLMVWLTDIRYFRKYLW
jgi:hypothetical protein